MRKLEIHIKDLSKLIDKLYHVNDNRRFNNLDTLIAHILLANNYNYIVRNFRGELLAFKDKPSKGAMIWRYWDDKPLDLEEFKYSFRSVSWEDDLPTRIKDIIGDTEEIVIKLEGEQR